MPGTVAEIVDRVPENADGIVVVYRYTCEEHDGGPCYELLYSSMTTGELAFSRAVIDQEVLRLIAKHST